MIVMFQGTNEANNAVTGAACIAAVMSAAKYNRKTLFIQMTESTATNAESLLIGKKKEETEIKLETYRLEDKGIDALVRRAETSKLVKENFDTDCEALLTYENMLDMASITKKIDFEINLTIKDTKIIFNHAYDVYDNIFVLLNGRNTTIMQELLELCDVYVTCFSQKPQKELHNVFQGKRAIKLITDFDNTSAYSAMYLKKAYGDKKIYLIPHNSGYRDACLSGTLLEYILRNMNNTHEDDNFTFMKHVVELMEGIMGKEDWTEQIPEPKELVVEEEHFEDRYDTVEEDDFSVEEIEEKKGLFHKRKKKKVISMNASKKQEKMLANIEENIEEDSMDEAEDELEEIEEIEEESSEDPQEELSHTDPVNEKTNKVNKSGFFHKSDKKTKNKQGIATIDLNGSKKVDKEKIAVSNHKETWICPECGAENVKKFCAECGEPKPIPKQQEASGTWTCPECGAYNTKKFCAECGCAKPAAPGWNCPECGTFNVGKFCEECGFKG